MTCRRPTISVRMEVLERLARAASEPDAPDSLEFSPMSWSELERDSLTEGLSQLLAHQAERQKEEERRQRAELREKALRREQQRVQAERFEEEVIERRRAEILQRRISAARQRAAEEIQDQLMKAEELLSAEIRGRAEKNALEHEMVKASVVHEKKRFARTSQVLLAAAALVGVVWISAFGQARESAAQSLARLAQDSQTNELSAETRVRELEAEIERRTNLTESEREWLERELGEARATLDASQREREEIDRRRPVQRPSKMAQSLAPVVDATRKLEGTGHSPSVSAPDAVRLATDVVGEGCSDYDPLCFDL